MNNILYDVLNYIKEYENVTQRQIALKLGHSLGIVNKTLFQLKEDGFLDDDLKITNKSINFFRKKVKPNAIILAAGFGMRMVPINTEYPKALINVYGETLIERQIGFLKEKGINDITIVVGFMKDSFEFLIDEYDVKLVYNDEYSMKNNLCSLSKVINKLGNTYIIPCDIWCNKNPFNSYEDYSWYMMDRKEDIESCIGVGRKKQLVVKKKDENGNKTIGISYINEKDAELLKKNIEDMSKKNIFDDCFWEDALFKNEGIEIYAKFVDERDFYEINTLEQLRELDDKSKQLQSETLSITASALNVSEKEITEIEVLKKGMTNRSFRFRCNRDRYIMRIPGEGTEKLINRNEEAEVYKKIAGKGICDDIIYINEKNGYKITKYIENARNCDAMNMDDVKKCMEKLREFHMNELKVQHRFDIFGQIDFYESLWNGQRSIFKDYVQTKQKVFELREYIEQNVYSETLTHIDAVPDNFLFYHDGNNEQIRIIDWEYAAMQDPHVDIAMFAIYACYDRKHIDSLIDYYFINGCEKNIRIKIYCYVAACGLLWSNWCEYKRSLGVEFGEYSLCQYRYAKEYYKIAIEEMQKMEGESYE